MFAASPCLIALLTAMPIGAQDTEVAPTVERITINGSGTMHALVAGMARQYRRDHPAVEFALDGGGSTAGIKAVGEGRTLIGMSARDIDSAELERYPDLQAYPIALDGLAIFVHASNTVPGISRDQVRAIFTGQIRDWSELGGQEASIDLICKTPAFGTHEFFLRHFGLESRATDGPTGPAFFRIGTEGDFATIGALQTGPHAETLARVMTNRNAIGYAPLASVVSMVERGGKVRALALDGVEPTTAHVENGTYPLARTLFVVTRGAPTGATADFIAFLQGPEAHRIAAGMSYIPPVGRTVQFDEEP